MTEVVVSQTDGGVVTLTLSMPPLNLLTQPMRAALLQAFEQAASDEDTHAILLTGRGEMFASGLELTQSYQPEAAPTLAELCNRIADCDKSVIAVLHGSVLGGALELALAADARVAEANTVMGFPGVSLGIVPGAGATQRLPRLTGAQNAMTMLTTGRRIRTDEARAIGLIDRISHADPWAEARELAFDIQQRGQDAALGRNRQPGFEPPAQYLSEVGAARTTAAKRRRELASRVVNCIEAAILLPTEAGLEFERWQHAESLTSPQSRALRHIWHAERRLKAGIRKQGLKLNRVGVIGVGADGLSLVQMLITAGLHCIWFDPDFQAMTAAKLRFDAWLQHIAENRGLSAAEAQDWAGRLTIAQNYAEFAAVDCVVDALAEPLGGPSEVMVHLDAVLPEGMTIIVLGAGEHPMDWVETSPRAANLVGMGHLSSPFSDRMAEIQVFAQTGAASVSICATLIDRLNRLPVRNGHGNALISQAMLSGLIETCSSLIEAGESPYDIDTSMRNWGFAAGPFWLIDQLGIDLVLRQIYRDASTSRTRALGAFLRALNERGRLGRSVGKGFYRYMSETDPGNGDPEVLDLIDSLRVPPDDSRAGNHRPLTETVLVDGLINTGAKLLEHRIASIPSDIDLVMVHKFGFPRWRGGPMFLADQEDLLMVRARLLHQFDATGDRFWQPSGLFDELIKNGRGFSALNPAPPDGIG